MKKKLREKVHAEELVPSVMEMKDKSKELAEADLKEHKGEVVTDETIEELLRSSSTGNNR